MKIFTTFFISFWISSSCFSQNTELTNWTTSKIEETYVKYNLLYGINHALLNGRQQTYVYPTAINFPYFGQRSWIKGSLISNNESFSDLDLMYDEVNDELLLNYFSVSGAYTIVLNKQNIESFSLLGHNFIHLNAYNRYVIPNLEEGFYELVFNGQFCMFLIKWEKKYQIPNSMTPKGEYVEKYTMYIVKGSNVIKYKGNSSLMKVFQDKKNTMKKYIKDNKIIVHPSNINAIEDLFRYYENIQ